MTVTGNVYTVIYEEKEYSRLCVISMPPSLRKETCSDIEDMPGNSVTYQDFDFKCLVCSPRELEQITEKQQRASFPYFV